MKSPVIVVGVDGSESSRAAVDWAAREAVQRGLDLRVISAYDWRIPGALAQIPSAYADNARAEAEAWVAAGVAAAREAAPGVTVSGEAVLGAPSAVLERASESARMVVVGSRGRGGLASVLLGSVSRHVATHAASPVAVVRGRSRGPARRRVVVGVDGSAAANAALGFALEEAAIRDVGVLAVRVYPPNHPPTAHPPVTTESVDPVQRRQNEYQFLLDDVASWRRRRPDVPIECVAIEGHPGEVLTDLSETAELVVVGKHGHGGLGNLFVGSVGRHLLHHSQSPVLIVRGTAVPAAAAA